MSVSHSPPGTKFSFRQDNTVTQANAVDDTASESGSLFQSEVGSRYETPTNDEAESVVDSPNSKRSAASTSKHSQGSGSRAPRREDFIKSLIIQKSIEISTPRKKRKRNDRKSSSQNGSFNSPNQYDTLSNLPDTDHDPDAPAANHNASPVSMRSVNRTPTFNQGDNHVDPDNSKRGPPPPPIVIRNIQDFEACAKGIQQACKGAFSFQSKGETTRLKTDSADDFRAAIKFLEKAKLEHHTFTPLGDKKATKSVIRGLDKSTRIEWINECLADQGIEVEKITQLKSQKGNKEALPLFLVNSTPDMAKKLKSITTLCYSLVKIEKYISPAGPTQCYKCQRYGHVSRHCDNRPRCLKCGTGHETQQCTKRREVSPTCANCQGAHTSNYKGCSFYKFAIERMQPRKQNQPPALINHHQQPPALLPTAPPVNPWRKLPPPANPRDPRNNGNNNKFTSGNPRPLTLHNVQEFNRSMTNNESHQSYPQTIPTAHNNSNFPTLPTRAAPMTATPTNIPPAHVPNIDENTNQLMQPVPVINTVNFQYKEVFEWANALMNDLAKAKNENRIKIIISYAMPIFMINTLCKPNGSAP